MKIKEMTSQLGRYFWCIYECEHCQHETDKQNGYNDDRFHDFVIPKMVCSKCGLNRAGHANEKE